MHIASPLFQIDAPLSLREEEVQLWRADLDAICSDELRWQGLLSDDEKKRAARFHFDRDRQHFTAARAILRMILSSYLSIDPTDINFCYSQREKPSMASPYADSGVTFNLSHSGGIALYAFARRRELGVDVEKVGRDVDVEGIAQRFFSKREQEQLLKLPADDRIAAFFRCWTRKEAYIKATGDGLSLPLSQFDVSLESGSEDALVATRPDSAEANGWQLREVPAADGYLAALCARGRNWRVTSWVG